MKGLVIAHAPRVVLFDAKPKISIAGRDRVRRERVKNVHAGVVGQWDEHPINSDIAGGTRITYDPYRFDSFVIMNPEKDEADFASWDGADMLIMDSERRDLLSFDQRELTGDYYEAAKLCGETRQHL